MSSSNAQRCREYRERRKANRPETVPKSKAERNREEYQRRKLKRQLSVDEGESPASKRRRLADYVRADKEYKKRFLDNPFGYPCDICHRLWFQKDLKHVNRTVLELLQAEFPDEDVSFFKICRNCAESLKHTRIPYMSRSNGFQYPDFPDDLPELDPISERLISPRLPFMQIRRLRWESGSYKIIGQVVNVPVDVNNMVSELPRYLDDDFALNVHIKRHLIHKSSYLKGYVEIGTIRQWLKYLLDTPLYKLYGITVNDAFFRSIDDDSEGDIEEMTDRNDEDNAYLTAQQQTMMWSEDKYLCIAPGQNKTVLNIIYDEHAEELSFPSIYLGHPRKFNPAIRVTPFMMATSEIRRVDRRGVTPQHILYMAMKIMRLRITEGLNASFKSTGDTTQITRQMIEDPEFINQCVERNFAFMKSIPNSVYYWCIKKRNLFAMMRQLGKPTVFLTLSASEIKWPVLLDILFKLRYRHEFEGKDIVEELTSLQRCTLVNEDPVTCVIYFNKLVNVIMQILKSSDFSPFGKYRVVDYFKRIEFQHRGSAHAHILLWLNEDPQEPISEDMPETIDMINQLCTLEESEPPYSHELQKHKHTFTCYKKNDQKCRFGAPFWPMNKTRILIPMSSKDGRLKAFKQRYEHMKADLESKEYSSLEEFLLEHDIESLEEYLDILRSGIHRPLVLLKRNMDQIWINNFNPWILNVLRSNMDIQFILEEYSCAAYVVEYVNKTNRGISNLQRELIKLQEEYPDKSYVDSLKELSIRMLNTVEICSQEAAWYLLRQPMSESSRKIEFIPTFWPHERDRKKKTKKQMEEEELGSDSTDIWKENIFQKYERRHQDLEQVSLAQFVAYMNVHKNNDFERRSSPKIIRYRQYDMSDLVNYKREMVTLYYPFRNEELDILDGNKFLDIYDKNEEMILKARKEFESNIDIEKTMEYCRTLCREMDELEDARELMKRHVQSQMIVNDLTQLESNNDDIRLIQLEKMSSVIRKRENVLSNAEYCERMRQTNKEQKELILEAIHRISDKSSGPLQIFFTGPAGSGKTFTIKLLMETYNRFSLLHNSTYNAYIACASTGKAAVAVGGTTVHSAFRISLASKDFGLSHETLNTYRNGFRNVEAIFIDEVSMVSAEILKILNYRLQQITCEYEKIFGGMNIIFCGDLRQLPPVMATPIYKRTKNSINGEVIWQSLNYYPLRQVVRQSDVTFSSILTKIGDGDQLSEEEIEVIESRFFTEKEVQEKAPDAIRLFWKVKSVAEYNSRAFENPWFVEAKDEYIGYKNQEQLTSMRTQLHKMKLNDTGGLPYMLKLLLNKPYMITTNIDVVDGLANGAIGHLKQIETNEEGRPHILWLEFPEKKIGSIIRMKYRSHITNKELALEPNWTPILSRSATISFRSKTLKCKRIQFPLIEACALTVHKSQGGTFDQVVFEYEKNFDQQLVYVALSRVTSLEGLYLTNPANDHKFYHIGGRANQILNTEFARLEKHPLPTICNDCRNFLSQPSDLSLVTLNVQSLKSHVKDLENDDILTRPHIMVLTETWLDNDQTIELKGYRCVTQFKREGVKAGGVAIYEKADSLMFSTHYQLERDNESDIDCGDMCAIESTVDGERMLIIAVYISPNTNSKNIKQFLAKYLQNYQKPIILTGDFNYNMMKEENRPFIQYTKKNLGLELMSNPDLSTTRGQSCIDLVFVRNMKKHVYCMNYVSYFSYHRPILTITSS